MKKLYIIFLILLSYQAIGQIPKFNKDFKVNGSLGGGGEVYSVDGIENRRAPWAYNLYGNVKMSYGYFSVPISFAFQDRQLSYDYSFNRVGISPQYKWARLLIGTSSLHYSPYTLSGRAFTGLGVELTPGKLYVSGLNGTIQNPLAIRDTLDQGNSLVPIYDRKIYGGKVGYRSGKNRVEMIFLKISDDRNSFVFPEEYDLAGYNFFTPKQNVNIGFNFGIKLNRYIELYANTAASAFTDDLDDPATLAFLETIPESLTDLFIPNTSSSFSVAGDGGINLFMKGHTLGVKFRRVDPHYYTLATDYFFNDVQQWTFLFNTYLPGRKIKLRGNIGIEKNNLDGFRTSTTDRLIMNGTLNFTPSKSFYASLKYSNFQTTSENQVVAINDTLRFFSVTQQYGLVSGYSWGGKHRKYKINGSLFMQNVDDRSVVERLEDISILNTSINATVDLRDIKLKVTPSLHYYKYDFTDRNQERYGLGVRVSKELMHDRLNLSANGRYDINDINKLNDGTVGYYRFQATYKTTERSTISWVSSYRSTASVLRNNFNELRSRIRYGINF